MRFLPLTLVLGLALSLPTHAGDSAHEDEESTIELNRARTRIQWKQNPIKFPCEDVIRERRAALEPGQKLPQLTIHGETHTGEYCSVRRSMIFSAGVHPEGVCVASEGGNAPDNKESDKERIKGLENGELKLLTGLLLGYETLKAPEGVYTKEDSDYAFSILRHPFEHPFVTDEILKLSKETGRKAEAAKKLVPLIGKFHVGTQDDADLGELAASGLLSAVGELREETAEILADLAREYVKKMSARAEVGTYRESHSLPIGLKQEVDYAIKAIDQFAKNPKSFVCSERVKDCNRTQLKWRDRMMAYNLALTYCDSLRAENPKSSVHAVVGVNHMDSIFEMMAPDAIYNKIPITAFDARKLDELWTIIKGKPETDGRYKDAPLQPVTFMNVPVGVSLQKDGLRIVNQFEGFDPLGNLPLSYPEPENNGIRIYGKEADVEKLLTTIRGPSVQDSEEMYRRNVEANKALEAMIENLYKSSAKATVNAKWPSLKKATSPDEIVNDAAQGASRDKLAR